MTEFIVKQAVAAFKRKDFELALALYRSAAERYGEDLFKYQIYLCNKKLSAQSLCPIAEESKPLRARGVSVIVPSCQGEKTIARCLNSLLRQNLSPELLEVVIVFNGDSDASREIVDAIQKREPSIKIKVVNSFERGVGAARNIGINQSTKEYITFVDDDDYVSPNYLSAMLSYAEKEVLVLSSISDVVNEEVIESPIGKQLKDYEGATNIKYHNVSSALTLNACKLVHYELLDGLEYDTSLRSGEDVVYWMSLICKKMPKIKLVRSHDDAVYYREIRPNSVSRQPKGFDFNVRQRLEVVSKLYKLSELNLPNELHDLILSKVRAQLSFCIQYLKSSREDYLRFLALTREFGLDTYVKQFVNSAIAKDLVISYCFPPYVDTSAVVSAKRVRSFGRPVDVIFNNMGALRLQDKQLNLIAEPFIGQSIAVNSPTAFSNWGAIKIFAEKAEQAVQHLEKTKGNYNRLYSRAMWPASHFAAALVKATRPDLTWIAEFSDPIYVDINGKARFGALDKGWLLESGIGRILKSLPVPLPENDSLFYWCEYIVYSMADQIIFTNENQLIYMLDSFPSSEVVKIAKSKCVVRPQPRPLPEDYLVSSYNYPLDHDRVNIGYFGSFYEKRGLDELIEALLRLDERDRSKILIHIFTQQSEEFQKLQNFGKIEGFIRLNPYVSYFDFLATATKFDVLFVNDSKVSDAKGINPYLPSKISDYLGSGVPVWAVCEKNSPMYKLQEHENIKYLSLVGDSDSYARVIRELIGR